jgi:hypothetical protein
MELAMLRHNRVGCFGILAFSFLALIGGCGLNTPAKDLLSEDITDNEGLTSQGAYENSIVIHVTCEIAQGLRESVRPDLPWLEKWGTTVTQTITVGDQGGLSPGFSFINPLQNAVLHFPNGNVVSPQSFAFSFGIAASANALRTETIQYTFRNEDILRVTEGSCKKPATGVLIDGDLRIREFIHDKATVAALGNSSLGLGGAYATAFNTFTEEITFTATLGGTLTPTWKLGRFTANSSSNLLIAQRINTNDLIITLGPLDQKASKKGPVQLITSAMNQHNARVQAAAIAVATQK